MKYWIKIKNIKALSLKKGIQFCQKVSSVTEKGFVGIYNILSTYDPVMRS